MSFRSVYGLKSARLLADRPRGVPIGRPRGAKAAGVRYEAHVALVVQGMFPSAVHGPWFEYVDANGFGVCQPDVLLVLGSRAVIFESKYTWTPVGAEQIEKLYRPVVEKALGLQVFPIVVCKNLTAEVRQTSVRVVGTLSEALGASGPVVWQCLGRTPARGTKLAAAYRNAEAMKALVERPTVRL